MGSIFSQLGNNILNLDWWKPNIQEIFVFIIIFAVIFVWVMLINYSVINAEVKKTSRCLRERTKYRRGATYSVTGYDNYNNALYSVDYDLNNKQYQHTCKCTPGKFSNTFKIDVYDMKKNKADTIDKICGCDQMYDQDDPKFNTYFKGYPSLVDFMNDPSKTKTHTDFFTSTVTSLN